MKPQEPDRNLQVLVSNLQENAKVPKHLAKNIAAILPKILKSPRKIFKCFLFLGYH